MNDIQRKQKEMLTGLEHPRLGSLTALFEEIGELAKALHEIEMYGNRSEESMTNFKEEIGDILFCIFELATAYEIDALQAYSEKLAKIEPKVASWREKYSEQLSNMRAKYD